MSNLSPSERTRYARQILLPQIGVEGQLRLKKSAILLIGVGGLGSPASLYLAAAGVGRIGVMDYDRVEETNLHRQILFGTADVGSSKIAAATARLRGINPEITISAHEARLTSQNALEIFRTYDLILDGTDNFPSRYLVNDACILTGKANVYGSVFRFEGQVSVFGAPKGPCYRCIYPQPPPSGLVPSCEESGVLGVLPGVIGTLQATEALKLLTGAGEPLIGRLLLFDALSMEFRSLRLEKNPDCVVCGPRPSIRALIDYEEFCSGGSKMTEEGIITPVELSDRMKRGEAITLIDVREAHEWMLGRIEGARHIPLGQLAGQRGTLDPEEEIVLYCRSGARSGKATEMLQREGFRRVRNLVGGILRWVREVDPDIKAV